VQTLLDKEGPGSALAPGLPVAGQTGTLDVRLLDPSTAGRVRAKTGTLNQVTSLAGYVTTPPGAQLSFSMMINVPEPQKITTADVDLEDELARILVLYPENVDVSQLGPKP
jgi:D-alanyl-D-alanine carboxypeptidase